MNASARWFERKGVAMVSQRDVARQAGVSGQTVSRVVNSTAVVDPATRARVESAMAELGYRPHRAARALRTGRTGAIGVVVRTLASVGNARLLEAVAAAADAHGLAVLLVTAGDDPTAALGTLADNGVDGIIVANEASSALAGAALPIVPIVAVDARPDPRFDVLHADHAGGAARAVEHLLAGGHATVHHLGGPAASFAAAERARGWRDALTRAGRPTPEPTNGEWTSADGYHRGTVLVSDPTITAVFAGNDQLALGLLRAAREAGRTDLAVVGFDDVVDAAQFTPPLTTIAQPFDQIGARAVDLLRARLDGTPPGAVVTIDVALVIRRSSTDAPG